MTYPPDADECIRMFQELRALDAETTTEFAPRKYEIIHDLAEAHFLQARPYFMSGLDNPDPDYRWACINALAIHWADADSLFVDKLMRMIDTDPDNQVRAIAISALGFLKAGNSRKSLERILNSPSEDKYITDAAREALSQLDSEKS